MNQSRPSSPELNSSNAAGENISKGRILVAEDNPSNQLVATYLLESFGYTRPMW